MALNSGEIDIFVYKIFVYGISWNKNLDIAIQIWLF